MCDVRPFCGLRYRTDSPDLSSLITPPYDVISPEERLLFYSKDPHNVIRLEYAVDQTGDSDADNKYTRSAETLRSWIQDDVLIRENRPAFYVLEHRFPYQDVTKSRWGLIARVRLEEFGKGQVKAHEKTIKQHSTDRYNLLSACQANFSPIMGMIKTENCESALLLKSLAKGDPNVSASDSYGVTYNMWVVKNKRSLTRVSAFFGDKPIYIADGHHRYETAVRYQKQQCSIRACNEDDPVNFIMMSLMDTQDPGLIMLPTHRLVRGMDGPETQISRKLAEYLNMNGSLSPESSISESVQKWLRALQEKGRRETAFGVYGLHGRNFCIFRLRDDAATRSASATEGPWKPLDVDLLHGVVFRSGLGIDGPEQEKDQLVFVRDGVEAISRVDSREYQIAFFLNPAPVSIVIDAADAGRRLPQKTTYFYPKTPAGLVINPLWPEDC